MCTRERHPHEFSWIHDVVRLDHDLGRWSTFLFQLFHLFWIHSSRGSAGGRAHGLRHEISVLLGPEVSRTVRRMSIALSWFRLSAFSTILAVGDCPSGDDHSLASSRISRLSAMEVTWALRAALDPSRISRPHRADDIDNTLWGSPRIHGRNSSNSAHCSAIHAAEFYRSRQNGGGGQSWKTFLRNQAEALS